MSPGLRAATPNHKNAFRDGNRVNRLVLALHVPQVFRTFLLQDRTTSIGAIIEVMTFQYLFPRPIDYDDDIEENLGSLRVPECH